MIYFILILGLVLIYFSIKKGQKDSSIQEKKDNFDSILENDADSFYEREILKSYVGLEKRVEILEEKLSIYEKSQNIQDKEKDKKDEEYIESILNVIDKTDDIYVKDEHVIEEKVNSEEVSFDNNNTMLNNEVITLYSEGKSVEEIASLLKIGKGEVLLRIGLQKHQK